MSTIFVKCSNCKNEHICRLISTGPVMCEYFEKEQKKPMLLPSVHHCGAVGVFECRGATKMYDYLIKTLFKE